MQRLIVLSAAAMLAAGCSTDPKLVDLGVCRPGHYCMIDGGVDTAGGPRPKSIVRENNVGTGPNYAHQTEGPGTLQTTLPSINNALGTVGAAGANGYFFAKGMGNLRPARSSNQTTFNDGDQMVEGGDVNVSQEQNQHQKAVGKGGRGGSSKVRVDTDVTAISRSHSRAGAVAGRNNDCVGGWTCNELPDPY